MFVAPGFDEQLFDAIDADLDYINFVYYGSLSDVSVMGAQLVEIVSVDGYDVAAFDELKIGLVLYVNAILAEKVRYIDETEMQNTGSDILPTGLETLIRTHAQLKIYVSIDLRTQRFVESELLTHDVIVE